MNFSDVEQLRVPPQSIDAEQAVLGGIMLVPDALDRVGDLLTDADFYRRDHQLIYRAIRELAERGRPYDAVTLGEWFESHDLAEYVAGGAYLIDLASNTPSAANIEAYAEIVRDKSKLRQLIEAGTGIVNSAFQPDGRDPAEIVVEAERAIAGVADSGGGAKIQRIGAGLGAWLEVLQSRYESRQKITGIPTPYNGLNDVTFGLQPATLYFFGARPSMGKSVVSCGISAAAAFRDIPTAFFSLEASQQRVTERIAANIAEVPFRWLLNPGACDASEDDEALYWDRLGRAVKQIKAAPLFVEDRAAITCKQFEARARKLIRKEGVRLIVVDHVHDFKVNSDRARFEYGEIVQTGKTIAKEFGIPVVMFGQLNRALEARSSKRPVMADLRESGEIEQKADVIVFLHREDYFDPNKDPGTLEMILAKNRDGETCTKYFLHRFDIMRIEDGERPLRPEPSPARTGFKDFRQRQAGN
jgi:replicative DNA helicase